MIIALQCCLAFCCTTARIGHKYRYIPSLLSLLPTPIPSLCVITAPHAELPALYTTSAAAAAAKPLQSCPTLCDPTDGNPAGSPSLGFSRQDHCSGVPMPSLIYSSTLAINFSRGNACVSVLSSSHPALPTCLFPTPVSLFLPRK